MNSATKRGDSTGIFMASVSKSGEFPFIHACKLISISEEPEM